MQTIAVKYNTTPTAISIAWLLSKSIVSTIVIGVSKMSQFADNLAAVDLKLEPEDIATLDEITQPKPIYPGVFNSWLDPLLVAAKKP
jgi:aryl-alcohol dehydrogenase-like predicted oxidoreductase